jgi:hypothetical protein
VLHGALHCDGTITLKSILENKVRGSGMELLGTGWGPDVGANEVVMNLGVASNAGNILAS